MDAHRIAALIAAVIVAINSIMAMFNLPTLDVDENAIYQVVSVVLLVGTWAYTIWLNFPFTKEAKAGQQLIDKLKSEREETD